MNNTKWIFPLFWPPGGCGIAGVSAFANLIVQSFHFVTYTDEGFAVVGQLAIAGLMGAQTPRWCHIRTISTFSFGCLTLSLSLWILLRFTFGPALFVGWIGGAILVVGGVMMCLACRVMVPEPEQRYACQSLTVKAFSCKNKQVNVLFTWWNSQLEVLSKCPLPASPQVWRSGLHHHLALRLQGTKKQRLWQKSEWGRRTAQPQDELRVDLAFTMLLPFMNTIQALW